MSTPISQINILITIFHYTPPSPNPSLKTAGIRTEIQSPITYKPKISDLSGRHGWVCDRADKEIQREEREEGIGSEVLIHIALNLR